MGRENVLAAYAAHGHTLDHAARNVLAVMALYAVDGEEPRRYFAGPEPLYAALGHGRGKGDGRQALGRALRTLVAAGLVERVNVARAGHRQEYVLHLGITAAQGVAERTPEGVAERTPEGVAERTPLVFGERTPMGVAERTPNGTNSTYSRDDGSNRVGPVVTQGRRRPVENPDQLLTGLLVPIPSEPVTKPEADDLEPFEDDGCEYGHVVPMRSCTACLVRMGRYSGSA